MGGRVLLVEDNPDIQSMVAEHLMAVGYDVHLASDGEVAMQMVRQLLPEVVCLDLNLPRISGYDVCEQIRADPALEHISILMTSARNSLDVRVFSLEAGADAYMTKPYRMEQLAEEIERLFVARARKVEPTESLPTPDRGPRRRR
jgi:two-component system alkaline phosphatase synthesis response regulator PhoP